MESLKIFTVYHKPQEIYKESCYFPIFAGYENWGEEFRKNGAKFPERIEQDAEVLKDNEGSNISSLNSELNEFTAIYYVWKNFESIGNPDIVGFTHYRRYFIFNEVKPLPLNEWIQGSLCYRFPSYFSAKEFLAAKDCLDLFTKGYDCLTTINFDARLNPDNVGKKINSCKDLFYSIAKFDPKIFDKFEDEVVTSHPEMAIELKDIKNKPSHRMFNMFVMRKELFFEYCEFVFPILFKLQKKNGHNSEKDLKRAPGYLGEYLTSMFINYKVRTGNLRVKELRTCFLDYVPDQSESGSKSGLALYFRLIFFTLTYLISFGKIIKFDRLAKIRYELSALRKNWFSSFYIFFVRKALLKISQIFT